MTDYLYYLTKLRIIRQAKLFSQEKISPKTLTLSRSLRIDKGIIVYFKYIKLSNCLLFFQQKKG